MEVVEIEGAARGYYKNVSVGLCIRMRRKKGGKGAILRFAENLEWLGKWRERLHTTASIHALDCNFEFKGWDEKWNIHFCIWKQYLFAICLVFILVLIEGF